MKKRVGRGTPLHVGVVHTENIESARLLKKEVETCFDCVDLELLELGPVLASHLGPGFFGIGFYSDEEWQPDQY